MQGKQQGLGGRRGCVTCTSEQNNSKKLCPGDRDILLQETASCFPLLRAFSQNTFTKRKRSLNRALRIPAASAPGVLPVRPPKPLTDPQGGHWQGHIFLRNSLVYFFSSLIRCCVRRPFYHQLPGQLAAFQPWGCQEKAAWRGDAAHVSFLGTFCWGRISECACSLAQAEERWWREAVHAGTSSIAKQNVALAAPWWLGQGWEALVLGSPWSQCLPRFQQTMTLLTANSLDGNIFVPGIFPNLKFTGMFSSNILSFCKN